jgi:hypothetical protein
MVESMDKKYKIALNVICFLCLLSLSIGFLFISGIKIQRGDILAFWYTITFFFIVFGLVFLNLYLSDK